jgi:POT family proton-dependent oligopeptide transporter
MSGFNLQYKKPYFWVLFFYESLLKLSINVIQISLVFYTINILNQTTQLAYEWLAFFGVTLYSMPIIIGKIVDENIGLKYAVKLGAFSLFIGALILFSQKKEVFILGMVTISFGSSLFKPNLVVILDRMFYQKTPIRNKYFSYFYLSSNVGSILSTIVVGISMQFFNLKNTLIISQLSLIFLSLLFFLFTPKLEKYYTGVKKHSFKYYELLKKKNIFVVIALVVAVYFRSSELILGISLSILIKFGIDYKNISEGNSPQKNKDIFRTLFVVLYAIVFFSLTSQIYYSFNLFIKYFVDRSVAGDIKIPVAWFFSINPFLVITLGGVVSKNLKKVNLENRMLSSLILIMIGYGLFGISTVFGKEKAGIYYIISAFVLFVVAEIITIPHLISEITYNIPQNFKSRIVGFWYLTMAFAQYIASKIALFICPNIYNASLKDFSIPLIKITIISNIIIFIFIFMRNKISKLTTHL